jgi:hypothetical protein
MDARRISDLVKALARARAKGARLVGKSAFEKELNDWINNPPISVATDLSSRGASNGPAVIPYELEMGLDISHFPEDIINHWSTKYPELLARTSR